MVPSVGPSLKRGASAVRSLCAFETTHSVEGKRQFHAWLGGGISFYNCFCISLASFCPVFMLFYAMLLFYAVAFALSTILVVGCPPTLHFVITGGVVSEVCQMSGKLRGWSNNCAYVASLGGVALRRSALWLSFDSILRWERQ